MLLQLCVCGLVDSWMLLELDEVTLETEAAELVVGTPVVCEAWEPVFDWECEWECEWPAPVLAGMLAEEEVDDGDGGMIDDDVLAEEDGVTTLELVVVTGGNVEEVELEVLVDQTEEVELDGVGHSPQPHLIASCKASL